MSVSSHRSGMSERSNGSTKSSFPSNKSTTSSNSFNPYKRQYHVTEGDATAWWSIGDFIQPGLTHQSVGLSLYSGRSLFDNNSQEEIWDLRESLQDLYHEVDRRSQAISTNFRKSIGNNNKVDIRNWLDKDTNNGIIRVFSSETSTKLSHLVPCTLATTAQRICCQCNMPANSLYMQLNGDIIRRLETFDCPLAIQNDYLATLGYKDVRKIQEEGANEDLPYLVKFYAGKPYHDGTYARNQLQSNLLVRKGKLLHQWVPRHCVISGTRLLIHRDKNSNNTKPIEVQLAKGSVEEIEVKGHPHCLKVTAGERSIYLSFAEESEYTKWLRKAKKATSKLPTKADLSNCHLEFLPETIFINDDLKILNLRHNVLRERPLEEDIYTIGWLDDLHRFYKLHSLNLADNDLHQFPAALCDLRTLAELNLASNKLEEIPSQICHLKNLQILQLHNNHLSSLPESLSTLKRLSLLTLAFNHFAAVPGALLQSNDGDKPKVTSLILAGNNIERFPADTLRRMKHVRKLDLRLNKLTLTPSEQGKLSNLELVTHLDLRDNNITDLDVRCLKKVEYLNCCRNNLKTLQVSGVSLKTLIAHHNHLESLSISPKPEWLETLDVSHNSIVELPEWVVDSFFLVRLNVSHNLLYRFPASMFVNCRKLKFFHANHNSLFELPSEINPLCIEEMYLQHNQLSSLPNNLLTMTNKLRVLNLSHNHLQQLPPLNSNESLNKLQELFLTSNRLEDEAVSVLCGYPRLKTLHLAHNNITEVMDRDVGKLEMLQELNVSGNKLRYLPACLTRHTKLTILRANSNHIHTLPDFGKAMSLRVLEVGCNRLVNVSMSNLHSSQLNLLDVSGNPKLQVDSQEIEGLSEHKKLRPVDPTGTNRLLWDLTYQQKEAEERLAERQSWLAGFSQTSGNRNKLSVRVLSIAQLRTENDGLFAVFDGGRNGEVAQTLHDSFPSIIQHELATCQKKELYMKYAVLSAHKKLRVTGQKLGASAVLCHILRGDNHDKLLINVANVGDCELVLCRRGNGYCLTRPFMVSRDREDCKRILRSDGIITEDDKVNGITSTTRMIGCSYLYPQIIPNPHFFSYALHPDDEFLIMATRGLWHYIGYQEAVEEVRDIYDPVAATKKLQDLAQAYGSKENIGVLILRIKNKNSSFDQSDRKGPVASEKPLDGFRLADECHDSWGLHDWGSVYSLSTTATSEFEPLNLTMQSVLEEDKSKSKNSPKSRIQYNKEVHSVLPEIERKPQKSPLPASHERKNLKLQQTDKSTDALGSDEEGALSPSTHTSQISIRPLPRQRFSTKATVEEEWESILQDRLSEEVKNRELEHMWGPADTPDMDSSFGIIPPDATSSNWSTAGKKEGAKMAAHINGEKPTQERRKLFGKGITSPWTESQLKEKLEAVASKEAKEKPQPLNSPKPKISPKPKYPRSPVHSPEPSPKRPDSVSAVPALPPSPPPGEKEDYLRYCGPTVDRDALLFHEMNQARAKSCSMASIDTVKSDIGVTRVSKLEKRTIPLSHSIEVIVRDEPDEGYAPHDEYIPEEGEVFEGYDQMSHDLNDSQQSWADDSFSDASFTVSDLDINSNSLVRLDPEKKFWKTSDVDLTPTNSTETLKSSARDLTPTNSTPQMLTKLQTASQYSVAQVSYVSGSNPSVASLVVTYL